MSFGEIIVILLVVVLLFGPDKIPEIARGLGQGVRAMKDATDNIKREVMSQIDDNGAVKQIEDEISEAKKNMDKTSNEVTNNLNDLLDDTIDGPIKRK
ncbi:twin-arginine translocase TatA/TatE family subunit [Apibacter sp.]|uniref:Sec-independent protein translocase subunit TatA/TatB n=1 Tax=Apibacter sp. TaxID=2023709 RepID=UPI0025F75AE1|nr:twin-arginine translocase TatA/TatE family subunit [Apibacter sp.]MCT6868483.1 twin-arginine translocase TatA/TatE family subunit [Apibacter sp.]